jgi:hypothetical protein
MDERLDKTGMEADDQRERNNFCAKRKERSGGVWGRTEEEKGHRRVICAGGGGRQEGVWLALLFASPCKGTAL